MKPSHDEILLKLYDHLKQNRNSGPTAVRDLPTDQRLAYHAAANRAARAKAKAKQQSGQLEPTAPVLRQILADAALMILATDGPGSEQIRATLSKAFPNKPGIPLTVTQRAKAGTLKPKILTRPAPAQNNF